MIFVLCDMGALTREQIQIYFGFSKRTISYAMKEERIRNGTDQQKGRKGRRYSLKNVETWRLRMLARQKLEHLIEKDKSAVGLAAAKFVLESTDRAFRKPARSKAKSNGGGEETIDAGDTFGTDDIPPDVDPEFDEDQADDMLADYIENATPVDDGLSDNSVS